MLTSIKLTNWRSHANSNLAFSKGTNLLIGSMGSGKSSVLDAICFALFGTFPSLEKRKLNLENTLRLNENSAQIELNFNCRGENYKVERIIKKDKRGTSTDAYVYKKDQLMDKGPVAVNEYIEQLLQVDYDLFTRAIYSDQNNIDYFLSVEPRRRKQELDNLLGLDKFETARTNLISVINRIKSGNKTLSEKFSSLRIKELEEKKQTIILEMDKGKQRATELEKEIGELSVKRKDFQDEYDQLKLLKDSFEILKNQQIKLTAIIENLKKGYVEVQEVVLEELKTRRTETQKNRLEVMEKIKPLDQASLEISKQIAANEQKIKNNKNSVELIAKYDSSLKLILKNASIPDLKLKKDPLSKESSELTAELGVRKAKIKELQDIANKIQLQDSAAVCPVCNCELNPDKISHIKNEREKIVRENNEILPKIELKISQIRSSIETIEKDLKSAELLTDRIKALKEGLIDEALVIKETTTKTENQKIIEDNKLQMQKNLSELTSQIEKLILEQNKMESEIKKKKEIENTTKNLEEINTKLALVKFDDKVFEEKRVLLENVKINYEKIFGSLAVLKKQVGDYQQIYEITDKELIHLKEIDLEIKYLSKLENELSIYKDALLETQISLRTNLIEAINNAMNEIWNIFYPHRNYKAIRINVTEKDYNVEILENGWKELETVASGGERACVALTLRVALATVLTPNLSWLILDEPTHNLDSEAIELLSNTLQFKVPSVIEQTLIISHEEGLTGSDFATNYVLTRDKSNLGPTIAQRV
ncbi:MAG: SMC family ATPase [Candidatus Micrarchaeota archaeon]